MKLTNKIIENLVVFNLCLISLLLISKLFFLLRPLLSILNVICIPLILSIFLYYITRPTKRFLESKGLPSGISSLLSTLIILIIVIYIIIYSYSIIVTQSDSLLNSILYSIQNLSLKYNNLFTQMNNYFNISSLIQQCVNYFTNSFAQISKNLYVFASSIGDFFAQVILIPIIMFYFLKDDMKIYSSFCSILPSKIKIITIKIFNDIDSILVNYIGCQVIVAFVIGLLMFIGYVLINMPNALVLSLFSFITAFIPYLGVLLGIIPAILISLSIGIPMTLKVIILTIIVQQLEGNVITPNITGSQLNIHPLITILIITIGIYFGGFIIAFISVPIYGIIRVTLKTLIDYIVNKKATKLN